MNRVFVLNHDNTTLSPCHPARARHLLKSCKAAVWRRYPFTIILKNQKQNPEFQQTKVKIDPGSKTTGLAVILKCKTKGWKLVWAANLEHRGEQVKRLLEKEGILEDLEEIEKHGIVNHGFQTELDLKIGFHLVFCLELTTSLLGLNVLNPTVI